MTRGVALSLVVLMATSASTMSRAAGTAATIPGAKLTTITSRGDARSAAEGDAVDDGRNQAVAGDGGGGVIAVAAMAGCAAQVITW